MKYAVEMGSGAVLYTRSSIEICSGIRNTDTQKEGDHLSSLL
jgi:hypothetical protein